MKLLQIKDVNEYTMDYYFPLVNYDETILAEGSLSRNVTNPWNDVLGEFIKERNLVGNDVDDIQDLIDEMDGEEMEAVIEEAGFLIYHFSGYSKGDHYAIISDRPIVEEYLEELEAIVFGGDWYEFSLVYAEEVKPLQVVVSGVDEFYGPEFFHQPYNKERTALFHKEVLGVLEELTSIAGTEGIDGVIIPNTNNYLDDKICEVILANTDLQFYEELRVTSGRASMSKFSKQE